MNIEKFRNRALVLGILSIISGGLMVVLGLRFWTSRHPITGEIIDEWIEIMPLGWVGIVVFSAGILLLVIRYLVSE